MNTTDRHKTPNENPSIHKDKVGYFLGGTQYHYYQNLTNGRQNLESGPIGVIGPISNQKFNIVGGKNECLKLKPEGFTESHRQF